MNLRDKLKAIEKPKSPPKASEKQFTDCYHGREMRELSEFPGAFDLDLFALRLMTQEELPDDLERDSPSAHKPGGFGVQIENVPRVEVVRQFFLRHQAKGGQIKVKRAGKFG